MVRRRGSIIVTHPMIPDAVLRIVYPPPPLTNPLWATQNRYSVLFAFTEAGEATHARTGAAAFASSLEVELRSAGVPAGPGNLRAVLVTNPVPEVPKCMPTYS